MVTSGGDRTYEGRVDVLEKIVERTTFRGVLI